jgi:hypothetical protein
MRLFLFSASVFYLLGLKLTSQFETKSSLNTKPEIKHQVQPPVLKPERIKSDSLILPGTKRVRQVVPSVEAQKRNNSPQS